MASPQATTAPVTAVSNEPAAAAPADLALPQDGVVEVDDVENDSAYGAGNSSSDWTSVTSSIYKGVIENGRRYQSLKEGEYWGPSDEQQFEAMANTHLAFMLHDQTQENPFFRSPIREDATHILDIGTGSAEWAIDVADRYPHLTVHGVDLYPPPQTWVPPNCILEVDDVTKPWTWTEKFDLIHLRWMAGAFTDEQWKEVYRKAYKNLKPGGWIEHVEPCVGCSSDDSSIEPGSTMGRWKSIFESCGEKMGNKLDMIDTMRGLMEEAGFVNVQDQVIKFPHGDWPKNKLLKEVGRVYLQATLDGIEGYTLFLLTHFGSPKPWTADEVQMLLMEFRNQIKDKSVHSCTRMRRVWCQKPFDAED